MNLCGDDRVEPAFYYCLIDAFGSDFEGTRKEKMAYPYARENPWGFVYKTNAKGFGVVGFKTLNHKFDGSIVLVIISGHQIMKKRVSYHVRETKSAHIEDYALY